MNDSENHVASEGEGEAAAELSPMGRLSGAFMRWRLRRDYDELGRVERDRFWIMLHELGQRKPPPWGYLKDLPGQAKDESLGAAIAMAIGEAVDEGRVGYFERGYLRQAVKEHLKQNHYPPRRRGGPKGEESASTAVVELDEVEALDEPSWSALQNIELLQLLFKRLNREEAYLLGWVLRAGKKSGELSRAAKALGHNPGWATPHWKQLQAKLDAALKRPGERGRCE